MGSLTSAERRRRQARVQAARRDVWRTAALGAATDLFAHRGYHETTMGDVAAEAGISLRALYQVCPGKDELFVAVIDDAFGRLLPVLPEPGGGTVPAVIEGFCAFVAEHRDLGLLYVRAHTSAVRLTDGRDPFAAYLVELQDRLTALVAAAQADGHASRLPAALLARSVIATLIATLSDGLINDLDVGTLAPDVVAVFAPHFT